MSIFIFKFIFVFIRGSEVADASCEARLRQGAACSRHDLLWVWTPHINISHLYICVA